MGRSVKVVYKVLEAKQGIVRIGIIPSLAATCHPEQVEHESPCNQWCAHSVKCNKTQGLTALSDCTHNELTITHDQPSTMNLNDQVPDFSIPTNCGQTPTLSANRGKNVVLYFYPKDSTPGCTTQGQNFRDLYPDFQAANTIVLGISRDSLKSHENFKRNKHSRSNWALTATKHSASFLMSSK